jgi:cytochrome P450
MELWAAARMVLNKTLSMSTMRWLEPTLNSAGQSMANDIAAQSADGAAVNLEEHISNFALEILFKTTFGIDIIPVRDVRFKLDL